MSGPPSPLRRKVFYVAGFDPRGATAYYGLFRRELRGFRQQTGAQTVISRPQVDPGRHAVDWTVDARAPGWACRAEVSYLRWDDLVSEVFARPAWKRLLLFLVSVLTSIFNGHARAMGRASRRFFIIWLGTVLIVLILGALMGLLAWLVWWLAAPLLGPSFVLKGILAGVLVAAAYVGLDQFWKRTREAPLYNAHLIDDNSFNFEYLRGWHPQLSARIEAFARELVQVARAGAHEEILLVGHSSGSFVAVEIMARALEQEPALGRLGPAVGLVTIGAVLPWVGTDPAANGMRRAIARVAGENDVLWVEWQGYWDWLNFSGRSPLESCGIPPGPGRNPVIRKVHITKLLTERTYRAIRTNLFRLHFQFVMATERPAHYDYFALTCGPDRLETIVGRPWDAIMTPVAATSEPEALRDPTDPEALSGRDPHA